MSFNAAPFGPGYDATGYAGYDLGGQPLASSLASSRIASQVSSRLNSPAPDIPWSRQTPIGSTVGTPLASTVGLVTPAPQEWVYLDYGGAEQGPFDSATMSGWLSQNYFVDTLLLRRSRDGFFITLNDLRRATQTVDPFAALLSTDQWDQLMARLQAGAPSYAHSSENKQDVSSLSAQVTPLLGKLSLEQSAAGLGQSAADSGNVPGWGIAESGQEPEYPSQNVHETTLEPGHAVNGQPSQFGQPDRQANRDQDRVEEATEASVQLPIQSPQQQPSQNGTDSAIEKKSRKKKTKPVEDSAEDWKPIEIQPKQKQKKKKAQRVELSVDPEDTVANERAESTPEPTQPGAATLEPFPEAEIKHGTPKPEKPTELAPAPAPVPAWNKPAAVPAASLSLKEIQQREMERKRQIQAEREAERHRAGPSQAAAGGWGAASLGLTPTPRTPGYTLRAPTPAQTPPLAQVQQQTQQAQQTQSTSSAPLKQQSLPQDQLHKNVAQSDDDDGFVPVKRRGPLQQPSPAPQPAPVASAPYGQANGARRVAKPVATPQQARPSDELVQWAKVSFRQGLRRGVDHNELLTLFLSLPGGPDAKEFIADSIYAYSTTLDGRRFAHEFLQRRTQAESTLRPGESWVDVLKRINPAMETDPSFKVVTNKKQRVKPAVRHS